MADWRKTSRSNYNQRLMKMLNNGLGNPYDVTFVVGPAKEEVKGHQFILKLHSPVFEEKFTKENNFFPIVNVQDGNKQDFQLFLQILYTGVMCNQPTQAGKLLSYAVQFKVWDLEEWCWKSLEKITDASAVTTYELAIKFGNNSVRDQALQFILRNASTILDSDEVLKFTSYNFFKVLASDELAATDETQVFKAVLRWGKEMCKRDGVHPTGSALRYVLTDLLPMVRFPVMSKSDFSMLVAPLELLTEKELISTLLCFNIDKDKRNDLPPGAFNGKERAWCKKRESGQGQKPGVPPRPLSRSERTGCEEQKTAQEHILHRLEPFPNDPARRRQFVERGSTYVKLASKDGNYPILMLKFSVDHPIWITSVGVNAGREYGCYDTANSQVTFVVAMMDEGTGFQLGISDPKTVAVAQLDKTWQLYFSKPVGLVRSVWYILAIKFGIVQGTYTPAMYQSPLGYDGTTRSYAVHGKPINFRFEAMRGQNPAVIGLTQGFIPTIGFKLHDPDAQQ